MNLYSTCKGQADFLYQCKNANPAYATIYTPQIKEQYGLVESDLLGLRRDPRSIRHISYLVSDVKALWLSKLPQRKAEMIANLPYHHRQALIDAFAQVEAMGEQETSLLKRRYIALVSATTINIEAAISLAKLYIDLGNIREVVKTTLRYKGRSDLEAQAMLYLDQVGNCRQQTIIEMLAQGQMAVEAVIQMVLAPAPPAQIRYDAPGNLICLHCPNVVSRGKLLNTSTSSS